MSAAAVIVENLGKRYALRHQSSGADGLRHHIESAVRSPAGWLRARRAGGAERDEFWALSDVSFDVAAAARSSASSAATAPARSRC